MVEKALRGLFAFMINTSMRAYEILNEYEFPEIKARKPREMIPNRARSGSSKEGEYTEPGGDIKRLGGGAFSTAYVHKDAPQDVTKGSQPQFEPDGYERFFRSIEASKDMQANPYMPRFRNISTFKTPEPRSDVGSVESKPTKSSYLVKMERLWKLFDLNRSEEKMLLGKMFTRRARDYFGKAITIDVLIDDVTSDLEKLNDEWIKDPDLLEALLFIRKLAAEYTYNIDLGTANNIMFRRTSVGPQVVINDPLGYSEKPKIN